MSRPYRPLDGVTVVEMTHMIMGPSCGQFLAYLGADVIKVEPPGGDKTRHLTGMGRGFFPTFNRGKRSIAIDLKSGAGLSALDKLLAGADVLVENFRDGALARMGLSEIELKEKYPKLILAACKGFLHGPYENRAALDEVVQMMTGMAYMTGPTGRPLRIGSSANDIMGGMFAAMGVMGALMEREKSGEGRSVRVGLFENCLLLVAQHMVQFDIEGREAPPMPEREFSWAVYDIFETADNRQIFVGAVTEGQWAILCRGLGLETLIADPTLQTKMDQINARSRTLPVFAEAIRKRRFDDLIEMFDRGGLPFAPIHRPAEMYDDPHVNRPGGLNISRMADGTVIRAPSLPIEVDGAMPEPRNLDIADVGADTDDVLSALGMSIEEIARAKGANQGEAA